MVRGGDNRVSSQVGPDVVYLASVPSNPNPTRRQLLGLGLGLGPLVATLAAGAMSPALVRVHAGQRFTLVLAQDLPSHLRKSELDLLDMAVERIEEPLGMICADTSVRRIGERIVLGVASDEGDEEQEHENQRLADHVLRWAEPVKLRIAAVEYGIMDAQFLTERLPFWRYWA
jgi:hypothetical protein